MEIGTVRQIDIDQEMQGAFLDYAVSVIVARALPDVRDGLKPVHRRILYAMHDMGLSHDKPYKKSARIVGEVLGKYHPHGDSAVYDAMARMAQDFSLRYVLVDGQGNFGSIDGDSPAAMRYTEARLSAISESMLADIDKDTVAFGSNFDDTLAEPTVLPALLPNLLVNGASGIAVGMTTNVPPHNLAEVVDALVHLIDHYRQIEEVTVEDLTRFIQGPDFPTGGAVYRYDTADDNGDRVDLIRNAYALGRGRLTVQANVHIEEMSRNRSRLVVTELPYQVNKTRLIERIAELVRDGKVEGITDLRDESDRQGMRICIELTRTVEARDVLSQLFRLTPMQTTFSFRMLALVDGEPRLLPLKRVLTLYLEHRQEIITRRSRYLLEKAKQRAHILEGLLKALDHIDEVVSIIRRSQTTDTARKRLIERLKLTQVQADAILDMPLKRLVALERRRIADEYKEKLAEIKYLEGLLRDPVKIRGVIREELLALKARFGDARRTRIVDRAKGHHTARELVEAQDVLVTLWQDGQVSMTGTAPRVSARTAPLAQLWANTRDDLVFFTAGGQGALVPLHQFPADEAMPVSNLTPLDGSDPPAGMLVASRPAAGEEQGEDYVTLATRMGRIKRVSLADLLAGAGRGAVTVINVENGDRLAWVARTSGQDEIVLATCLGQAIRFSEADVRPMGLAAAGVLAVKLGDGDAVAGMGVVSADAFVVTLTEQGYAKRTPVQTFPTQKRYGGGVQAVKLTTKTGKVAVAVLAAEAQDVVLTTTKGRVTRMAVQSIHPMGRSTSGYRSPQDSADPYLEAEKHGTPAWLAVLAGRQAATTPPRATGPANPTGAEDGPQPKRATRPRASAKSMKPASTRSGTAKPPPAAGRTRARKTEATADTPAPAGQRATKAAEDRPVEKKPRAKATPASRSKAPAGGAAKPTPASRSKAPAGGTAKPAPASRSKAPTGGTSEPGKPDAPTKKPPARAGEAAQIPLPLDSAPAAPPKRRRAG